MVGRQTSNDFGMYSWIDALADGKDQGMLVNAETGEGVSARVRFAGNSRSLGLYLRVNC